MHSVGSGPFTTRSLHNLVARLRAGDGFLAAHQAALPTAGSTIIAISAVASVKVYIVFISILLQG
jgi:hypothetical protein